MTSLSPSRKRGIVGIALGIIALLMRALAGYFPEVVENIYARGFFVGYRWIWDYSLGWLPFPWVYILVMIGVFFIGRWLFRKIRRPRLAKKTSWPKRFLAIMIALGSWAGVILFLFMVLWGFNYQRVPFAQQMALELSAPRLELLEGELSIATEELIAARQAIPGADTAALNVSKLLPKLEPEIRRSLEKALKRLDFPVMGRPRIRRIYPAGIWIGLFSASGTYLPWMGEGNLDAGVADLLQASYMAHELSHAYGHTHEGVCDFLGLLACEASEEPLVVYSGRLDYWIQLYISVGRSRGERPKEIIEQLPQGIRADLRWVREQNKRYQGWFMWLNRMLYDRYLKVQGMPEGIATYSHVTRLVIAWRAKNGDLSTGP